MDILEVKKQLLQELGCETEDMQELYEQEMHQSKGAHLALTQYKKQLSNLMKSVEDLPDDQYKVVHKHLAMSMSMLQDMITNAQLQQVKSSGKVESLNVLVSKLDKQLASNEARRLKRQETLEKSRENKKKTKTKVKSKEDTK